MKFHPPLNPLPLREGERMHSYIFSPLSPGGRGSACLPAGRGEGDQLKL